jgi:CHAT domain-containing protein
MTKDDQGVAANQNGGIYIDPLVYLMSRDPTLHSGLLLASDMDETAERGLVDGIMSAMEIAGLDLRRTELAVLSACDTVGSPSSGRGIIGLVSGFHDAGVPNVIATLYPVADIQTVELMRSMYAALVKGDSPAAALRRAQKAMRDLGYGSFFWAPFVLYVREGITGS